VSLSARLDALYAIGGGDGANRPAYSPEEEQAHALAAGWMEETGLEVSRDEAGNLFGRLTGREPALPEVWTGSHLDSVPRGGRLDGPLGVLAGLEAVTRLGPQLRTLAVVAFRDEEGSRFGRGCFGSRALCGQLEPGELDTLDADGVRLRTVVGGEPAAGGWLHPPAAYLEAHVEQGPVLAALDAPLGVVTSIVGLTRMAVTFHGSAGHAGTTPMAGRDDALVRAAAFVTRVRELAEEAGDGAVATVGRLEALPGAANVIPERVELLVDARAPQEATLAGLVGALTEAAGEAEVELLRRTEPVPMAGTVQDALRGALADLGLPAPALHSGAGHDAGVLGAAGVPAGMLFVRSLNGGVSHSPDEHSDPADVALCVDALTLALGRLAGD
jgi:allantoate deiminase